MKLTKKLETEILDLYHKYWDAYLSGNIRMMSSLMDEHCQVIGSAKGEVFNNRKSAIKYYGSTADQIAGKAEMRNRKINIAPAGSQILISEENDFFILIDAVWTFYGQGRISTLFAKSAGQWKIIHQHGSLPDARTSGGEQHNTDKIREENVRLKDAIKRRTIELEEKNRELEIEASLERVRSRTMGMQRSEELADVSLLLDNQVRALGIKTWGCAFHIYRENDSIEWFSNENGVVSDGSSRPRENVFLRYYEAGQRGESLHVEEYKDEACIAHYEYLCTVPGVGEDLQKVKESGASFPTYQIDHVAFFKYGYLLFITFEPVPEAHDIFTRFASVFEQTYTRFLDLQKAEAQAREAQIEVALERVRAKAMTMHVSEDLTETIKVFYRQIGSLTVVPRRCGVALNNKEERLAKVWTMNTTEAGESIDVVGKIKMEGHPVLDKVYESWVNQREYHPVLRGQEIKEYYQVLQPQIEFPDYPNDMVQYGHYFMFPEGNVYAWTEEPLEEEQLDIYRRFTSVLSLTYRRYFDLRKAEEQAREAQIEAAMEKVRGKALAMHKSEDFLSTAHEIFLMQQELGLAPVRSGLSVVTDPDTMAWEAWSITAGEDDEVIPMSARFTSEVHSVSEEIFRHWQVQDPHWQIKLSGESLEAFVQGMPRDYVPVLDAWDKLVQEKAYVYFHYFSFPEGVVFAGTLEPFTEDQTAIMQRFTRVFDFAYTRYTDLKQAEEQAWEAQIEAALEKVRSSALAMAEPADMVEVCRIISDQMHLLGIRNIRNVQTAVINADEITYRNYQYFAAYDRSVIEDLDSTKHAAPRDMLQAMQKSDEAFFNVSFEGEQLDDYNLYRQDENQFPDPRGDEAASLHFYFYAIGQGALGISTYNTDLTEKDRALFKRFRNVFDLAYRRFMDIEQATAQAREAQIEAALERVRASTMAMHRSEQLSETAAVLFDQLRSLGEIPDRFSIVIIHEKERRFKLWVTDQSGTKLSHSFTGNINEPTTFSKMYAAWKEQKDHLVVDLQGEELTQWLHYVRDQMQLPIDESHITGRRLHTGAFFTQGVLINSSHQPVAESMIAVMVRFARVFNQTYTRFLDLKKAEAQAREAQIDAALERVRAEIASMRTAEDLQRITPLVWREMKSLGLPFVRCGVFIIDEDTTTVEAYLSAPDGRALGTLRLPFDSDPVTQSAVEHWRKRTIYKEHWGKEEFEHWMQSMIARGQIQDTETYQGATKPPESLHLHFVPFTQGMLYVGNSEPLSEEEITLVQSLAGAFAMAYARYEDFVQLEKAKRNVESALSELKAAQVQLIHSEKMASLGELTAGIAHEIKNPLNFVNNFSEVSQELLDEIQEELAEANYQDAGELIQDVRDNLDKILHHGTRADSIVRGMLQHSRGTSTDKEPTDINALCDEYLRLSYHGLRAKDKSFNAEFTTDFDEHVPKVNVVPQDIGRVLLNLINNAFYACTERTTLTDQRSTFNVNHTPKVTVSTRQANGSIEITVADNGPGIPDDIVDKIFQPFFTTKPTGEGTGLGLSLAYDIVTKGHGGQLSFETEPGEGTHFIIQLPIP